MTATKIFIRRAVSEILFAALIAAVVVVIVIAAVLVELWPPVAWVAFVLGSALMIAGILERRK